MTTYSNTKLPNGISVFSRNAGPQQAPVVLLLHGFPSSSNQYRNLIPLLSEKYRVIAPDLPGFGFTEIPNELNFEYTFANIAETIGSFLDVIYVKKFAVYVFDYGAPTAFRLALQRPEAITAIVSQNGNAYAEGLGADFWAPLQQYWTLQPNTTAFTDLRTAIKNGVLTLNEVKREYVFGEANAKTTVDPASYTLDWDLLSRPGQDKTQLDLFYDYRTNVALYSQFQEYFKKSQVPLLAIWGKNDNIFVAAGAEAFKKDLPDAEVRFVDGGHFSVESHTEEIGQAMLNFLGKNGI